LTVTREDSEFGYEMAEFPQKFGSFGAPNL
jgi:hypothetical protein